jgi:hypothetical protein
MFDNRNNDYHRLLSNCLAQMSNILYNLQHKKDTMDNKIKALQAIHKIIPNCIRLMIYFKNKGE